MRLIQFSAALAFLLIATALFFASRRAEDSTTVVKEGGPVTLAAFRETVDQTDRPVLVKFGAPWCGPCRMVDEELVKLEDSLGSKVDVLKINVDHNRDLAQQFQVGAIPHMILFKDGDPISSRVGYLEADAMANWVANLDR
ncbi:MAG: thioredoxin domain-containing protein [Planctomycetota bacterium]